MTVEAMQKAALKSQKRKQLADEKREKDKVIWHGGGSKLWNFVCYIKAEQGIQENI